MRSNRPLVHAFVTSLVVVLGLGERVGMKEAEYVCVDQCGEGCHLRSLFSGAFCGHCIQSTEAPFGLLSLIAYRSSFSFDPLALFPSQLVHPASRKSQHSYSAARQRAASRHFSSMPRICRAALHRTTTDHLTPLYRRREGKEKMRSDNPWSSMFVLAQRRILADVSDWIA